MHRHCLGSVVLAEELGIHVAKLTALELRFDSLNKKQEKLMADIAKLAADFQAFKTDFTAFVAQVQVDLATITAPGTLTPEQQAAVDSIDQGVQDLDATLKASKS